MAYVKDALSKNEQIIVYSRKHPIVLLWSFVGNLLVLIVILAAAYKAEGAEPKLLAPILSLGVFPFCLFFYSYLKWWNEEYYLTTHRVIRSQGIINKRVADSSLEKVNDVLLSQSWIGRILDFGDVEILTASDIGANRFTMLKSPVLFKTAMLSQKQDFGGHEPSREAGAPEQSKGRISDLISGLEKLRLEGAVTEKEFNDKKTQLLAQM